MPIAEINKNGISKKSLKALSFPNASKHCMKKKKVSGDRSVLVVASNNWCPGFYKEHFPLNDGPRPGRTWSFWNNELQALGIKIQ